MGKKYRKMKIKKEDIQIDKQGIEKRKKTKRKENIY